MKINTRINSQIFKAYDIRGLYPQEINQETAYLIGRAFVKFLKKQRPVIVIGQDNRLSSSILFRYLAKGIIDQGGKVINIGLATTPMLYFATAFLKCDGGIEITASHNPAQYNGFKIVREKAIPVSGQTGLKEIEKIILINNFNKLKTVKKTKIVNRKIIKEYLEFNLKNFDLKKAESLKIIIDTANAVPGILVSCFLKKTNLKAVCLFLNLNGLFPNHQPDPLKKENLKSLIKKIKEKKADLGIAFDGDGDRIIFVDEKGNQISGDLITALISQSILKEKPGQKILYDIRSSNAVKEKIKQLNGQPIISRIGHSLIKEKMRKQNIVFAGELSGHYYHKDHYFSEVPIFVLIKILEIISEEKKCFSQIIKSFQKYSHSGEINFKIENKEEQIKKLKKKFKTGQFLEIDGLRVDFKDWWFLVRPSNTEPVIRLVVEAKTKKLMLDKIKQIKLIILS
jgi:phosphomannomutase